MTLQRALTGSILLLWLAACGPGSEPPSSEDALPMEAERATVEAQVRPGMLEMRRWREPRERIVIDRAGALVGTAGRTPVRKLFTRPERLQDFLFFVRTYRPFRLRNGDQDLAFGGQGAVKPGPVEQRMISEWARGLAAELSSGGSADGHGLDYGLVIAWHRGGAAGNCDSLVVFLDGEVRASACAGGGEELRGRLRSEQLARIYAWYESLKPLQVTSASEAGPTQAPARLTLAGRGTREPSPPEIAALQALSAALHRELMARHGALPAPQPVLPPTPRATRAIGENPAPEAPGPDLLVPKGPVAPLPPPQAVLPPHIPPPSKDDTAPAGVPNRPDLPGGPGGAGGVR
jgi:hypothetical protein